MWFFSAAKAVRKPLRALRGLLGQGMRRSKRPNGMEAGRNGMEAARLLIRVIKKEVVACGSFQ
jgi:hypothetical protein